MIFRSIIRQFRPIHPILAVLTMIVSLLLSACSLANPAPATPDANLIASAAAQTLEAGGAPATITALSGALETQSAAAQATQQAFAPTLTALGGAGLTPSAPVPAATIGAQTPQPGATAGNTSGQPSVSVSADTNCRQGPGTTYPVVSLLKVGASTTVHGRDSSSQWYYVASPTGGGAFCWLWGQYATVQGNTANLEVVQAPPPPTPSTTEARVSVSYDNVHTCGDDVVTIRVDNTGGVVFTSARVTVRDLISNEVLGQSSGSGPFLPSPADCPPGNTQLNPGETAYIAAPLDIIPPSGTETRAIVLLCTEGALAGACEDMRVEFEFP